MSEARKLNFYFRTRKEIEANAKRRRDRRKRRNGKEDPEEGKFFISNSNVRYCISRKKRLTVRTPRTGVGLLVP